MLVAISCVLGPSCSKAWITLSTGQIAIHWMQNKPRLPLDSDLSGG